MHEETYADAIGEIAVGGNVVRIDLVSLSPTERDASGKPKQVFRQRIVMPVDGFANSAELMQKALAGLIQSGAVTRAAGADDRQAREPAATGTPGAPGTTGPTGPAARPNGSPNFV